LVPDLVDGTPGVDAPPRVFDAAAPERRVGLLICWENVFAALSRDAVGDGARLLVHLTNDAWFGDSRAAAQHDAISVLRAVENAVPVVTVSNTGPSQIVDAHGRVLARLDPHAVADVVAAAVPIGRAGSFYTRHGDLFAAACAAVAAIALMDALLVDAWRRRAIDRFTLSGVGR
jgi:apolipoprotein N-acyltransferase